MPVPVFPFFCFKRQVYYDLGWRVQEIWVQLLLKQQFVTYRFREEGAGHATGQYRDAPGSVRRLGEGKAGSSGTGLPSWNSSSRSGARGCPCLVPAPA